MVKMVKFRRPFREILRRSPRKNRPNPAALNFPSPILPNMSVLSGQAKTFHILITNLRTPPSLHQPLPQYEAQPNQQHLCVPTSKPSPSTLLNPLGLAQIGTISLMQYIQADKNVHKSHQ